MFKKTLRSKSFIALLFGAALAFSVSYKASAATIGRVAGADRYKTAIEVSKAGWQSTSDYAVIATGDDYADALCAGPLAKKYNAPILLVSRDSLSSDVSQELARLKVKNIFIVGGEGVVSKNIETQLKANYNVNRLAGVDRFETATKIATAVGTSSKIVVATGLDFPDALSIAPIAAKAGMPILLCNKDNIPAAVSNYLNGKAIDTTYVVGGEGVINSTVASKFPGLKRLAGIDRYATNVAIMNEFQSSISFDSIFVATGEDFPDALSGSALAAKTSSPIVLTDKSIPFSVRQFVNGKLDIIGSISILGGTGVISNTVANQFGTQMFRVVIDPGHGDKDSGAVGPTGVMEKDVNLAIALKLGQALRGRGIDVVFTRTTDAVSWKQDMSDVGPTDLQPRCDIANNANADLFVSIHNNSFNGSAYGTETYYCLTNPAGQVYANAIQSELPSAIGTYNRGVKTANYYVLKYTNIPAVLVETAFIDNPTEEKLLTTDSFQTKSANAIADAIDRTLKQ